MAKRGVMRVVCHDQSCKAIFEAPTMQVGQFEALFRSFGWRRRGTVSGAIYYCSAHEEKEGVR